MNVEDFPLLLLREIMSLIIAIRCEPAAADGHPGRAVEFENTALWVK
jgi:hypothetical protein